MTNRYSSDWIRATLLPASLACIDARGESYGYEIAKDLHDHGLGEITGGTLYPVLRRMTEDHLVVTAWREGEAGPGRKYYTLTPAGDDRLRETRANWRKFVHTMSRIFGGEDHEDGKP